MFNLPDELQNQIIKNLKPKNNFSVEQYMHSLHFGKVMEQFHEMKQNDIEAFNKGLRPQFPFTEYFVCNWINLNSMSYLQAKVLVCGHSREFRKEMKNAARTRIATRNFYAGEQMLYDEQQRQRDFLARIRLVNGRLSVQGDNGDFGSEFLAELKDVFDKINKACKYMALEIDHSIPIKKLENFALSILSLVQCTTKTHFFTAALVCVGNMIDNTLTSHASKIFNVLCESLWGELDALETQGSFRDAITNWERMSDSVMLLKLREFMSFCMTFGTLEYFGLPESTASIVYGEFKATKKHKALSSFALAFCDVAEFVFSRLCVCVESKTLGPLFHSADDYAKWHDDCAKIMEWNLMLGQDCTIRPFSDQEFQFNCEEAIKKGEEYIKFAKNKERKDLNQLVSRIRLVYGDFMTAEIVGRPREAPFCILLSGDSSIGKTSIQRMLVSTFASLANKEDDPRYFYTRDSSDDFMSGFKSYMWYILMDDVATTAPSKLTQVDKGVAELFRYVQNIPCTANMADLNEKGKIAIRPDFIIATTNAPTLNAEHMFTCPSAARRRLPWRITPSVRPEFRVDGSTMLDPSKCVTLPGDYPDFWTFKIEEIGALPNRDPVTGALNTGAKETVHYESASLEVMLKWFVDKATAHRAKEKALKATSIAMSQIKKCKHHIPLKMCDECLSLETQSDIVVSAGVSALTSLGLLLWLWTLIMYRLRTHKIMQWFFVTPKFEMPTLALPWSPEPSVFPTRSDILNAGQKAADSLKENKKVAVFSVILGALAIWKLAKKNSPDSQIKFVKPVKEDEKEKTRWVVEIPVFDRCNVLPQSVSTKARPKEDVLNQIGRNVAQVTFTDGSKEWSSNCFFLGGFDMAINTHVLKALPDVTTAKFLFYHKYTHIGKNTTMPFDKRSFLLDSKVLNDVTLIKVEEFGIFPSVKGLLAKDALTGHFNGTYLTRSKDGEIVETELLQIEHRMRRNEDGCGDIVDFSVYQGTVRENTLKGMCGSPLILETSAGFVIGGIHSLGGTSNIACASYLPFTLIPKEKQFNVGSCNMGEKLDSQMQLNDNEFLQEPVEIEPRLRQRDPLAYRSKGLGEVFGSLKTGPSHPKSKVKSTYVREFFESKGMSTTCIAPVFSARCWHKGLDDMMSDDILISSGEANFVANCIARDFIKTMTYAQKNLIEFYDYDTAINGADGINGVDKLDFNTSTGFPMKKVKKKIFKQLPSGKYSVPKEVLIACDRIHENLEKKVRSQVIFSASLKDEPREKEKVKEHSIRIFMSAPMPYCIVMRQYYLSLCRVIQRSPLQFETAVGINAHSEQWDKLANHLLEFSGDYIVGDHSKYDKRMLAMYIYNMFKVAIIIIMHCMEETGKINYEERDEVEDRLHLLAIDTAYAFIDFNGTLVSFLKNHASGHILTVIINSFANSGYIRMAYRRVVKDDPNLLLFQERVRVVTYGDDFIAAVKPEIKHFNFKTMKSAMATFGVKITPAVKTAEDYDFLSITEIDFLKRRFVYSNDLNRWVGPLDPKSISKSLLISVRSESITEQEQAVYTMMSACQESFFHGEEFFNNMRNNILECIDYYKLHYLVRSHNFPTYQEFIEKYTNQSVVHVYSEEEYEDDNVFFDMQMVPIDVNVDGLQTQCECRAIMDENSRRLNDDPRYEKLLERDFRSLLTKSKWRFRKLVCNCKVATPYGFACTTFCWLCQVSPRKENSPVSAPRGFLPLDSETKYRPNQMNALTRVEQQTSTTYANVEGSYSPWSNNSCFQDDLELECQMSQSNIAFIDEVESNSIDLSERPDPTRTDDELNVADFKSFLSRPVKIYTATWAEATSLDTTFNPWLLWAQQSQIKNKLNNYGLFRGTLKIKMMVNAAPFFYGAGRLTYEPLVGYMFRDSVGYGINNSKHLIAKSQQRGFEFYPQYNQGGEMKLPFFYPKTWLDITSSTDLTNMGRCSLFTYTGLSNANNVSVASVTITIMAWCEDAELSAPTYALAVQSEYKKLGPISGPSSAVAEASRALSKIPVFKPFAMGTEVIATNIGNVAKYFGFTNVPTTSAQQTFKPGSHYGMASTEISTPYEKLGLDDQNELTIDPRVVGLPPKDELAIANIIERESFLTSVPWSASSPQSTMLFNSYVTPSLYDFESFSSSIGYSYYQTPLAHLSRLFTSWRGSIIFRFQFVCTQFHKGRVRITWDPRFDLSSIPVLNSTDTITTSFTKIIDIGETQDVEIEIPYMQALAFMTNYGTSASTPNRLYSTGALPVVSSWNSFFNGTLSVTVLNTQTSPVSSADITMLVFVKAGKDFVFANPRDAPSNFTHLMPQMEVTEMQNVEENRDYLEFVESTQVGDLMKIHMGESVRNLRQLLHRQTFYNCLVGKQGTDASSAGCYNKWRIPRYPQLPGYNSLGRNQFAYAPGLITTSQVFPVSYTGPSVFSHVAPLFVGARGAIVYNLNTDAPQNSGNVYMSRSINVDWTDYSGTSKQGFYNPTTWDIYNPSALGGPSKYRSLAFASGAAGKILTNQNTQAGLMAHFPYYSPLRFTSAVGYNSSDVSGNLPIPVEEQNQGIEIVISTKDNQTSATANETATVVDIYMMAGHDFNFYYFNCVPTFYYYASAYGTTL